VHTFNKNNWTQTERVTYGLQHYREFLQQHKMNAPSLTTFFTYNNNRQEQLYVGQITHTPTT